VTIQYLRPGWWPQILKPDKYDIVVVVVVVASNDEGRMEAFGAVQN